MHNMCVSLEPYDARVERFIKMPVCVCVCVCVCARARVCVFVCVSFLSAFEEW